MCHRIDEVFPHMIAFSYSNNTKGASVMYVDRMCVDHSNNEKE